MQWFAKYKKLKHKVLLYGRYVIHKSTKNDFQWLCTNKFPFSGCSSGTTTATASDLLFQTVAMVHHCMEESVSLCSALWNSTWQIPWSELASQTQDQFQSETEGLQPGKQSSKDKAIWGSWHRIPLTQVVVLVLWSMKKGLPLGAIRISQPGGRKLCATLCCGLGEL